MQIKINDKIKMINVRDKSIDKTIYTVIDIKDTYVKLKHPDVGGYFIFAKKHIAEVISESR